MNDLNKIDKKIGGQILSEDVFYIIINPPNKNNLSKVLEAVLRISN